MLFPWCPGEHGASKSSRELMLDITHHVKHFSVSTADVTGGQEARWDLGFGVCLQMGRSRLASHGYGPVGSQKFSRFWLTSIPIHICEPFPWSSPSLFRLSCSLFYSLKFLSARSYPDEAPHNRQITYCGFKTFLLKSIFVACFIFQGKTLLGDGHASGTLETGGLEAWIALAKDAPGFSNLLLLSAAEEKPWSCTAVEASRGSIGLPHALRRYP